MTVEAKSKSNDIHEDLMLGKAFQVLEIQIDFIYTIHNSNFRPNE